MPAWEYATEPQRGPQKESEPELHRSRNNVTRSAPPPRPDEEANDEEDAPILKKEKKKAVRSAAPPPAPVAPDPVAPEITYVDHEEAKFRNVVVEREILIPRHETVNVEKIQVNERVVNVDRVKVNACSLVFGIACVSSGIFLT